MSEGRGTIEGAFGRLNGERVGAFREKAETIRLFCPWFDRATIQGRMRGDMESVLDSMMPNTSMGQISLVNLRVAIINAAFPVDEPWYDFEQIDTIRDIIENAASPQERAETRDALDRIGMKIHRNLLASGKDITSPTGWSPGLLQHKIGVVDQFLLMGGVLEHFDADTMLYRRYPLSDYVTRRDKMGRPVLHIIREVDDPDTLPREVRDRVGANNFEHAGSDQSRAVTVYTQIKWDYEELAWTATQEAKGVVFHEESLGRHSPYFETVFSLPHGRNTPIGYLETLTRTMRSIDAMENRVSQLADIVSNKRLALGSGVMVSDEEFLRAPGKVVRGLDVEGGRVMNAAWFGADAIPEIESLRRVIQDKFVAVAEATLNGPMTIRDSERTTGEEIRSVNIPRLNNILGGALGPIIEQQHRPPIAMILRGIASIAGEGKSPLLDALSKGADSVGIMVGAAGIRRANELDRMRAFLQDSAVVMNIASSQAQAGVGSMGFDSDGAIRRLSALYAIDDDGLFRSAEQMERIAAETEQQIDAQNVSREAARAAREIAVNQAIPA